MTISDDHNPQAAPQPEKRSQSADERRFLARLLEDLAREDPVAHDALLQRNEDLTEPGPDWDETRRRVRAALAGEGGVGLSESHRQLAEGIKASLLQSRAGATLRIPAAAVEPPPGILTSLTRKLPPERAVELYRKIAPMVVHQLLSRVSPSVSLDVVRRAVDHLCCDDVQARLCACEHARDGILDELCTLLNQPEMALRVSREDMQQVLQDCGAMDDLIAMENCIRLISVKAG